MARGNETWARSTRARRYRATRTLFAACLVSGWVSPVWAGAPAAVTVGVVRVAAAPDEAEPLILDLTLDDQVLAKGLGGERRGSTVRIGLADFVAAVDFPIKVDATVGTAEGWFIRDGRTFKLDLGKGIAVVDGREFRLAPDEIERDQGDLQVPTATLAKWFPLFLDVDLRELTVRVRPSEPLPIQERAARANRSSVTVPARREAREPRATDDGYKLAAWPTVQSATALRVVRAGGSGRSTTVGVRQSTGAQTDLGLVGVSLRTTGDTTPKGGEMIDTARLTLSRVDPAGDLLGPLHATRIEAGEVATAVSPLLGGGVYERGARITNQAVDRTADFETTDLTGEAPPGWDVELYRNGVLIGTRRVGAGGRWSFERVDVFIGRNDFKIVKIDTNGHREEENRPISVGLDMARAGQLLYDVSLSQKDTPFYDRNLVASRFDGTARLSSSLVYGLSDNASLTGALNSYVTTTGKRVGIAVGGAAARLGDVLGGVNVATDTLGGARVDGVLQTRLWDHNVRLTTSWDRDLISESGTTIRGFKVGALIYRAVELGDDTRLGYGLSGDRSWNAGGVGSWTVGARASFGIRSTNVSWNGNYQETSAPSGDTARLYGSLTATTPLFSGLWLSGRMNYDGPGFDIRSMEATLGASPLPRLYGELGLSRSETSRVNTLSARLSWDLERFALGPNVKLGSDGSVEAMLELTSVVRRDPHTGEFRSDSTTLADSGAASVRVFAPEDGGRPLEGVTVYSPTSGSRAVTNGDGVAMLTDLPAHTPVDVLLDPATLPGEYAPTGGGVSVTPHPGVVAALDTPVGTVGDIEGQLAVADAGGVNQPLRAATLRLLKADGTPVADTRTAFDGLYTFNAVPVGRYRVELVSAGPAAGRRYVRDVEVGPSGGLVSLGDETLGTGSPVAALPSPPPPASSPSAGVTVLVGDYGSELGAATDLLLVRKRSPEVVSLLRGARPRIESRPESGRYRLRIDLDQSREVAAGICAALHRDDRPCQVRDNAG